MARERVILVDGTALIFRAFFAIPATFRSSAGVPTNATYGFALMFRRILAGKTPKFGAVIFDAPGKTFRDDKYPKYKAQRPPMPSDMRVQIDWIKKVVEAHDFPMMSIPGYEADDVIGTLTREAVEAGHEVQIVSGDKDFAQLVSADVRMLDTMKDVSYDPELVRKKWGVPPEKFVDFLALVGDKADNIPGVPGIGKKTATTLLEKYGDLETVLSSTGELKGKQKENLENHADDARMSKDLATIDVKVPLELNVTELTIPEVDKSKVDALYQELEFFSLLSGDGATERAEDADYRALTADEVDDYFQTLGQDGSTTGVQLLHGLDSSIYGALLGLAFSTAGAKESVARYLPLAGDGALTGAKVRKTVGAWLADPKRKKVTHDLRDVVCILEGAGMTIDGVVGDTRYASYLIDPTGDIPHRLDQIARRFLHRTLIPLKNLIGSGKTVKDITDVELAEVASFAGHLARAIAEAWPVVSAACEERGQTRYLEEVSLPLARVLARMQRIGIGADATIFDALGKEFTERRLTVEKRIHELAGRKFNVGSGKQLGAVLFDELKLPVIKRTKTGYSTAADVLERLAPKHEIATLVVDWRALAKLVNTYTRVLSEAIRPDTGRIHCRVQQTVSASGRLISTDPDLQRTPIRTPDGRRIREAFVAEKGFVMVSADWSQIELRILAHITEDPKLVESFQKGIDVHRRTASEIYDIDPQDVDATQRNVGKTVNFATIYGQGAVALGQSLGMPRSEAKDLIDRYFQVYAGVRDWLDETIAEAHQLGYCETVLGRRRLIPELSSRSPTDIAYGERIAANTPIQGSAADICKLAMLAIDARIQKEKLRSRMLLQIHDELVFEAPPDELDTLVALVRECMEHPLPDDLALDVPLVVDIGHGASWSAAH